MNDLQHEQRLTQQGESSPTHSVAESANNTSAESSVGHLAPIKLFVGSLPYEVNEGDLISIFDKFGEVTELTILRDRQGRSRGCAALRFATNEAADQCVQTLHNRFCCGSIPTPLQIRPFEKREPFPVTCFIEGLPYSFGMQEIWTSLSISHGPVMNVSMAGASVMSNANAAMYSAYVTFYKKSSAIALSNDSRMAAVYIAGMLCPSVRVTIMKYSPLLHGSPAPMMPMVPQIAPGTLPYGSVYPVAPYGYMMAGMPTPVIPTFTSPPVIESVQNEGLKEDDADQPMKLFVGCLPYSKTAQDIADLFAPFGSIIEVAILTDFNGKSRGAAFVTFSKTSHAHKALEELKGFSFPKSTRPINISCAYKQSVVVANHHQASHHQIGPCSVNQVQHLVAGGSSSDGPILA